jgi:hypothetical protein
MQSVVIIVQLLSLLTTNAKVETFQFYIHKWLLKLSSLVYVYEPLYERAGHKCYVSALEA